MPRDQVSAYGVIEPSTELDADGVIGIRTMVEKPAVDDAPSDLIIIGRYVLTPDVFAKIEPSSRAAAARSSSPMRCKVQAANGPFHGVLSSSPATTPAHRSGG